MKDYQDIIVVFDNIPEIIVALNEYIVKNYQNIMVDFRYSGHFVTN